MESFNDLYEKIEHPDRPHTIEDVRKLRATRSVSDFFRDCKGYHDSRYDEDVPSKYPDIDSEFNLDNMTASDLCDAFDRMMEYYDTLSDYQPIYRLVYDWKGVEAIDEKDIGYCWSRSLSGLRHYIYNCNSYGGKETSRLSDGDDKKWKLFIGETHKDNVDWVAEAFLDIWGWAGDSDENELRVWNISKVRVLKVIDMSNTEVNNLLHGEGDREIDWDSLGFTEDKSTGETLSFEAFKKMVEDNPKTMIKKVLFPLWQIKERDIEWFRDFEYDKELPIGFGPSDREGSNTVVNRVFNNSNYTKEDYERTQKALQKVVEVGEGMSDPDTVNWSATLLMYCLGREEIIHK